MTIIHNLFNGISSDYSYSLAQHFLYLLLYTLTQKKREKNAFIQLRVDKTKYGANYLNLVSIEFFKVLNVNIEQVMATEEIMTKILNKQIRQHKK